MTTSLQPITTYIQGDVAQLRLVVTVGGTAIDPTTVVVKIEPPASSGVPEYALTYGVDVAVVRDSAGHFHVNVLLTYPGRWRYRWVTVGATPTAAGSGATERYFEVASTALTTP